MTSETKPSARLTSLDQFRGYTMLGMLLVNFLGGYPVCPRILKHTHDYCSYADTIMPQFLFAAGFAMRLSLGKRLQIGGKMPWGRAIRRILGLALVAIVWYGFCDFDGILAKFKPKPTGEQAKSVLEIIGELFKRDLFQTLLHIAVTSLWILPVITMSSKIRVGYAFFSGILHFLISWWFNFVWVNTDPSGIDGGPLGFFSWAIPALCGTLACDAVRAYGTIAARRIATYGFFLSLVAWVMSMPTVLYNVSADQLAAQSAATAISPKTPEATDKREKKRNDKLALDPVIPTMERIKAWDGSIVEPPFVPPPDAKHRKWNYWMMSQRCGNLSYPMFAAGISLMIYALFLWACDAKGWRLGIFRTLGTNSLAAYVLHDIASWVIQPYFPRRGLSLTAALTGTATWINLQYGFDFELWVYAIRVAQTTAGFLWFTLFVYAVCWFLERMGWYIRV